MTEQEFKKFVEELNANMVYVQEASIELKFRLDRIDNLCTKIESAFNK